MEDFKVIEAALDHAAQKGAFNLAQSAEIIKALAALNEKLNVH
jgi:hypothetical protein